MQPVASRPRSTSAHLVHDAGAAGQPDREDQPARGRPRRRPAGPQKSRSRRLGQQPGQAVGVGQPVVVHQPDQVGAALERPGQPVVEAARPAAVACQRAVPQHRPPACPRAPSSQPLAGPVGRGVVDHQHLVQVRGISPQAGRPAAGAAPSRLKVTTTATMRRGRSSVTAPTLRVSRPRRGPRTGWRRSPSDERAERAAGDGRGPSCRALAAPPSAGRRPRSGRGPRVIAVSDDVDVGVGGVDQRRDQRDGGDLLALAPSARAR